MPAYYNEHDPRAAAWLRELIRGGHIAAGEVDERSIADVRAGDLRGYNQCHFFAGIGGWSLALRMAGVPDDFSVWTGSCPCQPFSVGNTEQTGFADERHLWPVWKPLIEEHQPSVVFGEQVANAVGKGWWDLVAGDLENCDYAVGAAVLPACGYGADHERKRLFWVADSNSKRREGHQFRNGVSSGPSASLPIPGHSFDYSRRALAGGFEHLLQRDGIPVQVERDAIKGYGNAIVPQVGAEFVKAYLETIGEMTQ